eukprot:Clim_evm31s141 gene=Clim_evmTU31s141
MEGFRRSLAADTYFDRATVSAADDAVEIDGSNGGGQILRLSVGLAAVTGKKVRVRNICCNRAKKGMKAQHMASVKITSMADPGSTFSGVELGSTEMEYTPGPDGMAPINHLNFNIGTAGSITLVLQAIFPLLLFGRVDLSAGKTTPRPEHVTHVEIIGGTHVNQSPTYDYFRHVFVALLEQEFLPARPGNLIDATKPLTHGLFPEGGGKVELDIARISNLQQLRPVHRKAADACPTAAPWNVKVYAFIEDPQSDSVSSSAWNTVEALKVCMQGHLKAHIGTKGMIVDWLFDLCRPGSFASKRQGSASNDRQRRRPHSSKSPSCERRFGYTAVFRCAGDGHFPFGVSFLGGTRAGGSFGSLPSDLSDEAGVRAWCDDLEESVDDQPTIFETLSNHRTSPYATTATDKWLQDQLLVYMSFATEPSTLVLDHLAEHTKAAVPVIEGLTGTRFVAVGVTEHEDQARSNAPRSRIFLYCTGQSDEQTLRDKLPPHVLHALQPHVM